MEFSTYLEADLSSGAERLMGSYEGERTSGELAKFEQTVQGILYAVGRSHDWNGWKCKRRETQTSRWRVNAGSNRTMSGSGRRKP